MSDSDPDGSSEEVKHFEERALFLRFCGAASIEIREETIEQPDPPDIVVDVVGEGRVTRVAFELVHLNDPADLAERNTFRRTQDILNAAFDELPGELRSELKRKYGDAQVFVTFTGVERLPSRKRSVGFVWDVLRNLPDTFDGEVSLQQLNPPPSITRICVTRCRMKHGPNLRAISAPGQLPLRIDQILKKLATRYGQKFPLELVAIVEYGDIANADDAYDRIRQEVAAKLPESDFQAVWMFEGMSERAWKVA